MLFLPILKFINTCMSIIQSMFYLFILSLYTMSITIRRILSSVSMAFRLERIERRLVGTYSRLRCFTRGLFRADGRGVAFGTLII